MTKSPANLTSPKKGRKPALPKKARKQAAKATDLSMLMRSMGLRHRICFPFSPQKAVSSLQFVVNHLASAEGKRLRLSISTFMVVLWFADLKHFQDYGRPVTGTRWAAYPTGPVARDILSLLQGDPIWLCQLVDTGHQLPFELKGAHVVGRSGADHPYSPDRLLSKSDREALKAAIKHSRSLKEDLVAALRGEAFQLTPLYEDIPWEFLLPANIRHDSEAVQDLVWTSRRILL